MAGSVADVDPGSPFCRQGSQASYLIVERTTETARRACSSRAMQNLLAQARSDTELCIKCTKSFQVSGTEQCLPRSLTQETCSVSSRIALPRLPREEEGPHHRVAQIWGRADQLATLLPRFFGINKIFRELLFSCISDYRRTAQSTNIASHHSNCSSVSLLVRI